MFDKSAETPREPCALLRAVSLAEKLFLSGNGGKHPRYTERFILITKQPDVWADQVRRVAASGLVVLAGQGAGQLAQAMHVLHTREMAG